MSFDVARNVRSGPLESRTSRGKLPVRNAPYWCVLSPSVALGYRKGARGGAWLARLHDDETGKRVQEKIGKADDTLDADGDAIGQREGVVDAIRATHAETDEDIANIGEDEAMTRRALELLDSGGTTPMRRRWLCCARMAEAT